MGLYCRQNSPPAFTKCLLWAQGCAQPWGHKAALGAHLRFKELRASQRRPHADSRLLVTAGAQGGAVILQQRKNKQPGSLLGGVAGRTSPCSGVAGLAFCNPSLNVSPTAVAALWYKRKNSKAPFSFIFYLKIWKYAKCGCVMSALCPVGSRGRQVNGPMGRRAPVGEAGGNRHFGCSLFPIARIWALVGPFLSHCPSSREDGPSGSPKPKKCPELGDQCQAGAGGAAVRSHLPQDSGAVSVASLCPSLSPLKL